MKAYGGVDVYIHVFLTSVLVSDEWSASRPGRFTRGERDPGTHWRWDWVDPRACLDDVEKRKFLTLPGLEIRPLGCPARSQSLYRLSYPGSSSVFNLIYILCLLITAEHIHTRTNIEHSRALTLRAVLTLHAASGNGMGTQGCCTVPRVLRPISHVLRTNPLRDRYPHSLAALIKCILSLVSCAGMSR
jgi:hypothetical protein